MQIHEVKRPGPSHDRSETTPNTFLRVYIVYIVNGAVEHAESAPQGDEDAADTRMPRSRLMFTPPCDVKCSFLNAWREFAFVPMRSFHSESVRRNVRINMLTIGLYRQIESSIPRWTVYEVFRYRCTKCTFALMIVGTYARTVQHANRMSMHSTGRSAGTLREIGRVRERGRERR